MFCITNTKLQFLFLKSRCWQDWNVIKCNKKKKNFPEVRLEPTTFKSKNLHVTSRPPGWLWFTINDFVFSCGAFHHNRNSIQARLLLLLFLYLAVAVKQWGGMELHNETSDHKSVIVCALTSVREPQTNNFRSYVVQCHR